MSKDCLIPDKMSTTISMFAAWFKNEHRVLSSNLAAVFVSFFFKICISNLLKGWMVVVKMSLHMIGSP